MRTGYLVRIVVGAGSALVLGAGCSPEKQSLARAGHQAWKESFDTCATGQVPPDWSIRQTNPSKALATWKVTADPTAPSRPNVLALAKTENVRGTFNLAIADKTSFKDLELSVSLKGVSGKEDQGGGPIWRCIDENNYYVCRLNPLESNFRVYKVVNSKRTLLQSVDVQATAGQWYTIRAVMVGNHITCYLDGKKMLDVRDDTFPNAGKVGLWTKADAASVFDDLSVTEIQGARE